MYRPASLQTRWSTLPGFRTDEIAAWSFVSSIID
jgi:hypothetical protein